jgi:hypothetical protein
MVRFPGVPANVRDQPAIDAAAATLGLDWGQHRLDELRDQARQLVRTERRAIMKSQMSCCA